MIFYVNANTWDDSASEAAFANPFARRVEDADSDRPPLTTTIRRDSGVNGSCVAVIFPELRFSAIFTSVLSQLLLHGRRMPASPGHRLGSGPCRREHAQPRTRASELPERVRA